jgi:hypothetical protein
MEKTQTPAKPSETVTIETRIQILLEEYRALYFTHVSVDGDDRCLLQSVVRWLGFCQYHSQAGSDLSGFLLGLPIALVGSS